MNANGKQAIVEVYSGGQLVLTFQTVWPPSCYAEASYCDFLDKSTNKVIRVGGDFIVKEQ